MPPLPSSLTYVDIDPVSAFLCGSGGRRALVTQIGRYWTADNYIAAVLVRYPDGSQETVAPDLLYPANQVTLFRRRSPQKELAV